MNINKNKARLTAIFLAVLMCLQISCFPVFAGDASDYVTVKGIELSYRSGGEIGNGSQVGLEEEIFIRYEFDVSDDVSGGDYVVFTLPKEINLILDSGSETIPIPLEGEPDVIIAYVSLVSDSPYITVTFEDVVEEYGDIDNVYFSIEGQFDADELGEGGSKTIEFEAAGETISITLNFDTIKLDIEKELSDQYTENGVNYQVWKITANASKDNIYEWEIRDTLSTGLEYVSFQFEGYGENELPEGFTADTDLNPLLFTRSGLLSDTVVLYITTNVTDFSLFERASSSYTVNNEVLFSGEDKSGKALGPVTDDADAEIEMQWLLKDGTFAGDTESISWEIKINPDKYAMYDVVLTDILPSGTELVDDSIKIKDSSGDTLSVARKGSGSADVLYTTSENADKTTTFVLEFPNITDAYTITYVTKVTNPIGNIAEKYYNTATLTWKWKGDQGGGSIENQTGVDVYYNYLSKGSRVVYPHRQYITWSITVNASRRPISGAVTIVDNLNRNSIPLILMENSEDNENNIEIRVGSNKITVDDSRYSLGGDGTLTFFFEEGELYEETGYITFNTAVTDLESLAKNGSLELWNRATMYEGEDKIAEVNARENLKTSVLEKTLLSTERDEFEWEIIVNRYGLTGLGASTLTDTLPPYMVLEDVEMYEAVIIGTGNSETIKRADEPLIYGEDYDYEYNKTEGTVTFSFEDKQLDGNPYYIVLRTKLTEEFFETTRPSTELENTAELYMEGVKRSVSVSASGYASSTPVKKTATFKADEGIIYWEVLINADGRDWNFDDAVLKDQLQEGLALDIDTVSLIKCTVDNGNLTEVEEIQLDKNASINYDPDTNWFIFTLPDVESGFAYKLIFGTDVLESNEYSNNIAFEGVLPNEECSDTVINAEVSDTSAGAISNRKSQINLHKTDGDNGEPLPKVTFELRDEKGIVLETQKTDAEGNIHFKTWLKYDTNYDLHETEVPEGYVLSEESIPVLITKTDGKVNEATLSYSMANEKMHRISLHKADKNNDAPLSEAVFELRDEDDLVLETGTTDEEGNIQFETWLRYDTKYYLYETEAPKGYDMLEEEILVLITKTDGELDETTLTYNVLNEKTRTGGGSGGGKPKPTDPDPEKPEKPDPEEPECPDPEKPEKPDPCDPENPENPGPGNEGPGSETPDPGDPGNNGGGSGGDRGENPKTGGEDGPLGENDKLDSIIFGIALIWLILLVIFIYRRVQSGS